VCGLSRCSRSKKPVSKLPGGSRGVLLLRVASSRGACGSGSSPSQEVLAAASAPDISAPSPRRALRRVFDLPPPSIFAASAA